MYNTIVKKLIARNGERELLTSSSEERHHFVADQWRPEFEDERILGVKFIEADTESLDSAEESSWFINPIYVGSLWLFASHEAETSLSAFLDGAASADNSCDDISDPQMAAEFLPELLVIQTSYPDISVFEEYQHFYSDLLKHSLMNIPLEEKIQLFVRYMQMDYNEKEQIILNYA